MIRIERLDQIAAVGLMQIADEFAQRGGIGGIDRGDNSFHKFGTDDAVRIAQLDGALARS